jgi:hypothetical protein
VPIEYSPRAGKSKFHWWRDTRRFLLQVVRMTLSYEPLRVFGPAATVLGFAGVAKLVYDLIDKDLRVGTNTLVVLGMAAALAWIGLIADLLVQLTRPRLDTLPAVVSDRST